ncbi:unnamed protein product [Phaeothamnion confervicola]
MAADMAARRRGRIVLVSSITAAAPNPGVAAYAASKAYTTSLAQALQSELEPLGVGVTCAMPGATRTCFGANSNAGRALCFRLPFVAMDAPDVAQQTVDAALRGDPVVVPGWANKMYMHALAPLVPRQVLMLFVERMWR